MSMRSRFARHAVLPLLAALAIAAPRRASADGAQDKAMAVQLFKDAKDLMNKGDFAAACPKLEASARMDPSADGTVLNLGLCYEGLGKWATAWGYFNESIVRAKKAARPDREQLARERIAAIEPKLSRVTIHVASEARIEGLNITWDGKGLEPAVWDTAVPVDPGVHHMTVSAPSRKTWETDVPIAATSDSKTIDIPNLAPRDGSGTTPTNDASKTTVTTTSSKGIPTSVYVLGGAGIVLVGATIGARLEVNSASDDRRAACLAQTTPTCDDTGKSKIRTWETISFVSAGLAAVSIGAAVYLYASAPSGEPSSEHAFVRVVPTTSGLRIEGAF